jgi:heme exporter protein D
MMNLGPHAAFIIAAYAAAIVVVAGLVGWVAVDFRAQTRLLGDLDAQGVTRRSAAIKEPA